MISQNRLSDRLNSGKDLINLIEGKVQESQTLDYKRPAALSNHNEVAKDISSFANSAGGIIVYGIAEDNNHYPCNLEWLDKRKEKGDPKETLENVIISTINPKINNIVVKAIPSESDSNSIILVVDIPESASAPHMANNRYFKRYNFQAIAMEDDEIRALMGRRVRPDLQIKLQFEDSFLKYDDAGFSQPLKLLLLVENIGKTLAQFLCVIVHFPKEFIIDFEPKYSNYFRWIDSSSSDKQLVCINDTAILHPIRGLNWNLGELTVKVPADTEGILWSKVYAKDCPEKLEVFRYKIQNFKFLLESTNFQITYT